MKRGKYMKPKILLFAGGYLPAKTYGGPVVSMSNIVDSCGNLYRFKVIACNHEKDDNRVLEGIKEDWNQVGKADVIYLSNAQINFKSIYNIIKNEEPDIIYLNSIYCTEWVLPALLYTRKYKIPILLAPRGQIQDNAIKTKIFKKVPYVFFIRFLSSVKSVYWQSTCDEETTSISKWMGVKRESVIKLRNIPQRIIYVAKKNIKECGNLKLVYISRIHPIKNLHIAINAVKKLNAKVQFDIYGPVENLDYWEKCKKIIYDCPSNINVKYKGLLDHNYVPKTLSSYDAFILPSKTENYGHAIVEAMLTGCPVIISDNTPWSSIKDEDAGYVISLDNECGYADALDEIATMDEEEYNTLVDKCLQYCNNYIKLDKEKQKYIDAFNMLINNHNVANKK